MIISHSKNILFGEHAVVYPPNTAIIAANNLKCKVEIKKNHTSSIINLSASGTVKLSKTYEIANLLAYLNSVREVYKQFKITQEISVIKELIKSEDDLMKLSIAVALDYLKAKVNRIEGFSLYVLSEVPAQSGFGSSAVFSSAVIAAILDAYALAAFDRAHAEGSAQMVDKDLIFDLTMEIEAFQHLNPSGEGPAAAIFGNLIKLNKDSSNKPKIAKIQITNPKLQVLMKDLVIVHSGMPAETTGELVNFVKQEIQDKSKQKIIESIEINTQKFLELNNKKECEESKFIELINNNGVLLEELDLVAAKPKEFIDKVRSNGGAAKISGAGGRSAGSGALLVYHPNRDFIRKLALEFDFEFFDIKFGIGGLSKV